MQSNKGQVIILYLVAILGTLLYISLIFNNNLWMDEAFSAVLINTNFSEMMSNSAKDTLPPLYNIISWLFTHILGFQAPVLRLTSILPIICVLFMSSTIIYKRWGFLTSLIFSICISGMPSMLYYGAEIRMYALSLFFVTASGIIAYECFFNPTFLNYALLTFFSLGSAYTHHFAFVSSGAVWFILFICNFFVKRKYIKYSLFSLFSIAAGYIPCIFSTLSQMNRVNGYFTMPEVSLSLLITCLKGPFITNVTPVSILLIMIFIITPIILVISNKSLVCIIPSICGYLIFILTLSFGFFVTLIFKANIFSPRYLFPTYGLLWLGFAICFSQSKINRYYKVFCIFILTLVLVITYKHQFEYEYLPNADKMVEYFKDNVDCENDNYIIFEDNYQIEICFRYYFPGFKPISIENASSCKGVLWYIEVPGFEEKSGTIKSNGYKMIDSGSFDFDRYTFNLYKLVKD